MKECSCVNLFSENIFSLATCKMIFQFGHEKFRLGPAHLGGFSTSMFEYVLLYYCAAFQLFFVKSIYEWQHSPFDK